MSGESLSVHQVASIGKLAEAKLRLGLLDWLCKDEEAARDLGLAKVVKELCSGQK